MAEDRTRVAQEGAEHFVALPSGFRLGKYQLEAVLGQGGFGITYRGRDLELDRAVAVKEYLPAEVATRIDDSTVRPRSRDDQANFQWGLERFLIEARALARFDSNPSIVRVHDYMQANGTAYMIMALIEGTPLSAIYRREAPLSEERLKAIVLPILDGLENVHDADFLHRDIKPSNILVRGNGQPVLIDFGAARQSLGEKSRSITSIFTPGYAPFEQYMSSGKQGPWTDIYALAATLYHGVSGAIPPQATDRMREDTMPPAAQIGAGRYSPHFLASIDRGLEVHENRRPHHVALWRDMLTGRIGAALTAPMPAASLPPPPAMPLAQPKHGYRMAAAAALGFLLAGGVGAGIYFGLGDREQAAETVQQRAERLAEEARLAAEEARKAQQAAEAQAQLRAEQEAQQRGREQQRRREQEAQSARAEAARREAERARLENDAQRQRAAEEEARRQQDVEAQRREELQRAEQERRALEEARRQAEAELVEARRQAEEARRQADELRLQAERVRAASEEERKRLEGETARKAADEAKVKAEADAKRRAEEEAKKKAADEAKAKAEAEAKARAEAEARRKAEDEARRRTQTAVASPPAPPQPAPAAAPQAAPAPAPQVAAVAPPADPAAYVKQNWTELQASLERALEGYLLERNRRLQSIDRYQIVSLSAAQIVLQLRITAVQSMGYSQPREMDLRAEFKNEPPDFPVTSLK